MSQVKAILAHAREKQRLREAAYVPIDYAGVKRLFPKQKAALTRALHSGDPSRVVLACKAAVEQWSQPPFNGHWPDDWGRWQRALNDALGWGYEVKLEDL